MIPLSDDKVFVEVNHFVITTGANIISVYGHDFRVSQLVYDIVTALAGVEIALHAQDSVERFKHQSLRMPKIDQCCRLTPKQHLMITVKIHDLMTGVYMIKNCPSPKIRGIYRVALENLMSALEALKFKLREFEQAEARVA